MPSSHHLQINEIVDLIILANPEKLLDIGVGFGKFGFLAREYLELWSENSDYHTWKRQIDGIEAFEPYITPAHRYIYNSIFTGNALEIIPELKDHYDLILMIDVFEHFTFEEGWKLLGECRKKSRNILISVPLDMSEQDDVFGNLFETHKYPWQKKDFRTISDTYFLPNIKSLICLIGEDSLKIGRGVKKRRNRDRLIRILEILRLKTFIKSVIGRNH
jgi:hypothetical protein